MHRASQQWAVGSSLAVAAGLLLLGGAVGQIGAASSTDLAARRHGWSHTHQRADPCRHDGHSGRLPYCPPARALQPGSRSAAGSGHHRNCHAAAGGFSALTQWDIKRVLAYSTISQIGYMFVALGVGAWSAAIFHFMTHAFFKALLFLSAGIVINALHQRAQHLQNGRPSQGSPGSVLDLLDCGLFAGRIPADHRRFLQQRPDHLGSAGRPPAEARRCGFLPSSVSC